MMRSTHLPPAIPWDVPEECLVQSPVATLEKLPRLPQVERPEAFGNVVVHRSKNLLRYGRVSQLLLQPGKARRRPQFPSQGAMGLRKHNGLPQAILCRTIGGILESEDVTLDAQQLWFVPVDAGF